MLSMLRRRRLTEPLQQRSQLHLWFLVVGALTVTVILRQLAWHAYGPRLATTPLRVYEDAAAFLDAVKSRPRLDRRGIAVSGIRITNDNLSEMRFANTRIYDALFTGVVLDGADLSHARFEDVEIRNSMATGTDFSSSYFVGTTFENTRLNRATFDSASFDYARFERSDLTDATFYFADMRRVHWAVDTVTPRTLDSLAAARNLDRLTGPTYALFNLARQFKANGYTRAERALNAAIRRSADPPWWEILIFDYTCSYGTASGRLVLLALLIWWVGALLYYASLFATRGKAGIYLLVRRPNKANSLRVRRVRIRYRHNVPRAIGGALLFSTLTSLTSPIRGIALREWILRSQSSNFDMDAHGWVRVIAGTQAILTLVLIIVFFAVYFGSPFDVL